MAKTKETFEKYVAICERAEGMNISAGDRLSHLMDIESADMKFNLRLDDWLNADDENFAHDFCGIYNHANRATGFPVADFNEFLPRFAAAEAN